MKKSRAVAIVLCLLLLLIANLPASATGSGTESRGPASPPSSGSGDRGAGYLPYSEPAPLGSGGLLGAIARTMFSLVIVIGMLYVVLWAIKKMTGGAMGPFSQGPVRVVGRIYLSPKIVVYFLRLVDEMLVIGANTGNISLLATIKDDSEMLQIENALRNAHGQAPNAVFSRFFDKSFSRFQKALEKEDAVFDDQLRKINEQIGRLKGLTRKKQKNEDQ